MKQYSLLYYEMNDRKNSFAELTEHSGKWACANYVLAERRYDDNVYSAYACSSTILNAIKITDLNFINFIKSYKPSKKEKLKKYKMKISYE